MQNELQRPLSGNTFQLFLKSLSEALKDSGVTVKTENTAEQTAGDSLASALKVHFCIGINSVTRTLERMPHKSKKRRKSIAEKLVKFVESSEERGGPGKSKPLTLQAILVAMDVQPKILVNHLAHLCNSRGVPMVPINGGDGMGSVRLGEVLGLRTAVVIGVKSGSTPINKAIQAVLKK